MRILLDSTNELGESISNSAENMFKASHQFMLHLLVHEKFGMLSIASDMQEKGYIQNCVYFHKMAIEGKEIARDAWHSLTILTLIYTLTKEGSYLLDTNLRNQNICHRQ